MKVAINGFGRIGRCILRENIKRNHEIDICVINCGSGTAEEYKRLFAYDSIHGRTDNISIEDGDILNVNGKKIQLIFEKEIEKINWSNFGAELIFECTGRFTKRDASYQHISKAFAKKVLVSAPCEQADSTLVYGVNHATFKLSDEVISIGSCTTNCLAPIAKIINDEFGIDHGFMTTIHAYTNDQNLHDAHHKDPRRGRNATLSMVPTSTGAAKAIGLVIPELKGKLDGSAVRVPIANVSLLELNLVLNKNTSIEELNNLIKKHALNSDIIYYTEEPLVSVDFNGTSYSAIFDATLTKSMGNLVKISAWYDNESGFSNRMLDIAKFISTKSH